jgi:hypothetical protein
LVLLTADGHHVSSLAADPDLASATSPLYHRACAAHTPGDD